MEFRENSGPSNDENPPDLFEDVDKLQQLIKEEDDLIAAGKVIKIELDQQIN